METTNKCRKLSYRRVTLLALRVLLLVSVMSCVYAQPATGSSSSSNSGPWSLPSESAAASEEISKAFLILCTSDGKLYTLDAWTGNFHSVETAGPPLVTRSPQKDASGDAAAAAAASIVPGLDGRLYWQQSKEDGGQLQPLELTISTLMDHPVRTCDENDCGILTATAHTQLLALDENGRLVWNSGGTGTTENESEQKETPVGRPHQTVLLQRKDYWVQQVSSRSGKQVWNVSLGTYQALEFDDEEEDEEGEGWEDQLLLPGRVQDKRETLSATINIKKSTLPAIQFSDSGRTLSAIDRTTLNVVWRIQTPSVLVSVFGLYKGKWRTLHIIEEADTDTDTDSENSHDGPAIRLLTAGSDHDIDHDQQRLYDQQRLMLDWSIPHTYSRQHSPFTPMQQGLLPSAAHSQEPVCLSGDCPNLLQLPLRLPASPPVIVAQQGLVLSWSVVTFCFYTMLIAAAGGRLWYMRKKNSWLRRTAEITRRQYQDSSNSNSTLERSNSLPGLRRDAIKKLQSHTRPHSMDLTMGSPSPLTTEVGLSALQQGGIPLVRYSRYASEFEELAALGKGGFGTVFTCRNVLDGRDYAVKKVTIAGETSESSFQQRLQRVLREVKILAVLDHPNIVRYYTAWLEIEKEEEHRSRNTSLANGEASLSGRDSFSNFTEGASVSQWTVESPVRGTPYHRSNPLGWENDLDNSLPSRRHFQQENTDDDSESMFERSRGIESTAENPIKNRSRDADDESLPSSSPSASQSASRTQTRADRTIVPNSEQPASNSSKPAAPILHTLYIQMQLCTQKTVGDFLKNPDARKGSVETGVDIHAALALFLQIVQAVRHVHTQGLIHRDLKPCNCFMDESGTIKVGDFGLSREASDKVETAGVTAVVNDADQTAGVGTRSYASPEQMEGSDYDCSTDVFSLGIGMLILYCVILNCIETNLLSNLDTFFSYFLSVV
jgi:serine/threonine protein kinase